MFNRQVSHTWLCKFASQIVNYSLQVVDKWMNELAEVKSHVPWSQSVCDIGITRLGVSVFWKQRNVICTLCYYRLWILSEQYLRRDCTASQLSTQSNSAESKCMFVFQCVETVIGSDRHSGGPSVDCHSRLLNSDGLFLKVDIVARLFGSCAE